MTPYAVTVNDIPRDLLTLFQKIRNDVEQLPDFEGEVITCHALCSALSKKYSLTSVDGYFHDFFEHSWLVDEKIQK